jgi:hypothetical protein
MDRRSFLSTSTVAIVAPLVGIPAAVAADQPLGIPTNSGHLDKIATAARDNRMPLDFDAARFSGAAYDWLLQRGRTAHAFMIGEEHGIAENPKLAAHLFAALAPEGYRYVAVEVSPPMAIALDGALSRGASAFEHLLMNAEARVPFFGLREEADWLIAARAAAPGRKPFLWGLDYDLAADRYLLRQLAGRRKPRAAEATLEKLAAASAASWAKYEQTKNPQFVFSFAGDPELVEALERAWPQADKETRIIMETLRETLAINQLWNAGRGYDSNVRRAALMRANLLRYWREKQRRDPQARLFMKMGASHMVRGSNMSDVFDIGTLIPELVAETGGETFHLLVLPGPGTETANLDPTSFRYTPGKRNEYGEGTEIFDGAVLPGKFTLFDTGPLRPLARSADAGVSLALWRIIHGFDAVLIMTESHPSTNV